MRILIIQLARLGDLYMSWPIIRALKRKHPEARIELLIRPLFKAAVEGLDVVDEIHELPTQNILSPFFDIETSGSPKAVGSAVQSIALFVSQMRQTGFQEIYNLTFSPLSSWLVSELAFGDCQVYGYTRNADGTLALPDSVSAYFYAQVGIEKANRVHLTTLFAQLAGVELDGIDWRLPTDVNLRFPLPEDYICIHVSASQDFKSLTPEMWGRVLHKFCQLRPNESIVLLGSFMERAIAESIMQVIPRHRVVDLVGKTKLVELFPILLGAKLLVGGDSAPMHVASFTQTRCLNISIGAVNFWETGPLSDTSYIARYPDVSQIYPERIAHIACDLLENKVSDELVYRTSGVCSYACEESQAERFSWNLIEAIYLGGHFPVTESLKFVQAIEQLYQVNEVILTELKRGGGPSEVGKNILSSSDDVIAKIYRIEPAIRPIIDWIKAERIKIGPGSRDEIVESMKSVHLELKSILRVYRIEDTDEVQDGAI